MIEVNDGRIEIVRPKRAVWAAFIPFRSKHEVIDDKLASLFKEISKRLPTAWAIECVLLLDFLPGELAPALAHLVPQPREFLFLLQKSASRGKPFVVRNHNVIREGAVSCLYMHFFSPCLLHKNYFAEERMKISVKIIRLLW